MSYFDFPRMNFTGSVNINVGTVNNDDYGAGGTTFIPPNSQNQEQVPLRLSDSVNVQALTYGMSDSDYITWCNTPLDVEGGQSPVLPGEWNYYGDMGVTFNGVNVVAVNLVDGTLQTSGNTLIGTNLSFNNDAGRSTALICDVNPEDVPTSQIFADIMALRDSQGNSLFQGAPSKAVTRWINFFRNANLQGSAGASGVFQHVIPISNFQDPGVQKILTALGYTATNQPVNPAGFVVRYSIYQTIPPISPMNYSNYNDYNTALMNLYNQAYPNNQNPGIGTVSGTIGLYYSGEMQSITMGHYLIPPAPTGGPTPPPVPQNIPMTMFSTGTYTTNNGQGNFQLGPVVAKMYPPASATGTGRITLDVCNAFPENYVPASGSNPATNNKFAFTEYNSSTGVILGYIPQGQTLITKIADLDYANTNAYINGGGLMDITGISSTTITDIQNGSLVIAFANDEIIGAPLLTECDYMIASDQVAVYAEQNQSSNLYRNDAPVPVNCCVNVYYKGSPITTDVSLIVQEAQTTPNIPGPNGDQLTGNIQTILVTPATNNKVPLTLTAKNRGNLLYRVAISGSEVATATPMPCNEIYNYAYLNLATDFYINLRVLPQDDYSAYIDANGNAIQTIPWSYLYDNVLQYYNLIFPAMGLHVPFEEAVWQDLAATIYQRVDIINWPSVISMPRTRDLSQTRRQLIQAWCKQYMPSPPTSTQA